MKTRLLAIALLAAACAPASAPVADAAATKVAVGSEAPDFTLVDVEGQAHTLSAMQGKTVVLEWYNPDCPFVKYAHGESGPLRTRAADWSDKGVVWWAINSGAEGKQGHGAERNKASLSEYGLDHPILLDEAGTVGKTWGAMTTPHMYVIAPDGTLAYAGALDNAPLGDSGGKARVDYVDAALTAVLAGDTVKTAKTKPYGCSVKY